MLYARHPANAISHGPDVNLTRATPAKSVEYAAKGEYLSEEQSSINSLPQTGDTVKNATTSWAPGAAWQTPSLIEFFKTANASTGFHELGHHMLRVMMDISKLDGASAQLKDDINTILTHAGVTMEEFEADRDKRTQAHEYFARSWETYLSEGKAPTPELQGVFDRIRQWMIDVYHDVVQALGIDLSDDMRDVFDRLLATPEEIDAAYEARKTVGELTAETDLAAERIKALEGEVTNLTEEKAEAETPEPPADPAEEAREPVKNANTAMVRTAAGTEVEVRYRVAEADSLIASNTETGGINPDYPQELQPRQRTRESSIMQINRIASQLDPELLGENRMASDGAPIVGPDAVVESGNGRVLAIRQAYKTGGAEKYRAWLKENAERFGLDAAELDGMKAPVLVRERTGEVDRAQFAREANEASVSRMSRTEQAKADAARITPEMLAEFDPDKPVQGNRAFVQMFADGIVGRNELGSFLQANGRLSQEGLQRLTNALFAKAYGDTETLNRLSESLDDDIRNITNAMFQSSPQMGAFEIAVENGEAKPELSIREDITAAANMLSQLRQNGMSVPDFLAQIAMFEDADISPEAKRLVKFFDDNKRSMKRIAAGLANYARLAMAEGSPDQVAMFDTGRDKATLLNEAINSAENPEAGESYAQEQTPPLIFKLTGDPVSKEYMAALEKLEDGGPITEEEYNAIPEIQDARKRVAEGSTLTMTGREAIRQKVYDKLMAYGSAVTKVVDGREKTVYNGEVRKDRRADIIIGLPASGKSSALVDPISIKYKSMLIDSDEAKQLIPEFDDGFGAGFVHEESKKIVARVQKKATDEGRNIVIPIVGSNYAKLKEGYIDALRKKGYKVYVHIADINPNVAAGRNLKRFATTGRFVDLVVTSFSYGNKPLEVFERVKKEGVADGYSRIDNSVFPGRWVEGTEDLSHDMGDLREGRGRVHRGTEAAGGNGGIELNAEETGGNSQEGTAPRFASEDTTETETPEEAYIRGKNLGEDYGIKEGIAYQKKKDAAKLRERLDAEIQKRKDRVKALRAAYKRKAALRREVDKMTRQIRRALRDDKIIWHAQQEIQALYEEAAPLSKSIKDVKIAALRELHEKVMTLQAEGRRELEMKRLMDTERVNKARDELMTPMLKRLYAARPRGALTGREDVGKQYEGLKGKGRQFLDWAAASLMGANRFFDWMDGAKGTFDGPWVRWFVDRGNEATDTKLKHLMERRLWIENRAAERGVNIKDLAKARDVGVPKGKLGNSTRWTVDELMSIYAGMKNEKSRAAILYGNFGAFGEEAGSMAARCVEALTEKERAFADDIIKEYELNFDRINDALIDVYNRGMAHEENYTPMKRLEYSTKDGLMSPDAAEALMNGQAAAGGMMRVEKGFMNSRAEIGNENQAAIDLGLFSIWNSQVDVQEHAAAFGGLIRDMRRILMGRTKAQPVSVQKAVKEVHGDAAWKNVKNYFNILARDNRQIADDVLNTSANWLARNMSKVYLCANLGTAAKQFSSFPRFLPYSGAGHLLSAIGQFTTRGRAFLEEVYALDPQLQNRQGNLLLNEMMEAEGGTYAKVINMGMAPIGWVDRAASAIGWKAVYDANIAKGLSQQDAIKAAQRAVTLTQPTTLRKDAPRVYQGSGLARLAMVFTNDCAQTFGITVYDLAAACRRGDAPGFLYTLAGVTLAAGMMRALTYGGPDEDDEESWAEWWRSALLRQSVEVVPILGKSAIHLWDTKGYSTGEMSPYLAPFAKMLSGANGLWDDKEDNNERAVWNLIEGGSLLAGFPSVALHRLRRVGQDVADGEAVKALQHMIGQRVRDKKARKALRM
ncbi:MAG: zeta toxin family protein [Synergistaceae bacterium]|nr:zeta toxin family protein [Synergistaceae bacterium]